MEVFYGALEMERRKCIGFLTGMILLELFFEGEGRDKPSH